MSNYTKTTNFATKDALASGNPAKIVKGTEIDTEFNNIAVASSTKANKASPVFTGTATLPVTNADSLSIGGDGVTVTGIKDEDDMASNSATKLASQQSIKAYVDSQVTAQDLDVTDGTTSISIDLDSEALSLLGGTGVTSTASGNGVTMAIDGTVATLTGTQTLTNKTLTTPVISGNLTTDGNIDGRDVATDGTKLDTVETNADVTDTTNVTAAGALMDSEVTNLAQVKAFDSTDYATAAQGTTADAALPKAGGAMTGAITTNSTFDGRDVATDGTKLDGIEALADVTDTANVTAAGALMDSELTSIASVKALDQGVATTDSPTFAAATVTGEITANGGIALGDNDKATFGASDDLEIYHDGSNSIIKEGGSGSLLIRGSNVWIQNADGTETGARFITDGAIDLRYNNAVKLATTSTGIDVTGTATMDGLVVENNTADVKGTIKNTLTAGTRTATLDILPQNDGAYGVSIQASGGSGTGTFQFNNKNIMKFDLNNDISFYEDTGTTPKLFWDASAESLGINTDSPSEKLHVNGTALMFGARMSSNNGSTYWDVKRDISTGHFHIADDSLGNVLTIRQDSGNVGIGTSSPARPLDITDSTSDGSGGVVLHSYLPTVELNDISAGGTSFILQQDGANTLFKHDSTERMRIDSSGNVGIGMSPTGKLSIRPSGTGSEDTHFGFGANLDAYITTGSSGNVIFREGNGAGANTERMRIDSSGNLLVGTTDAAVGVGNTGTGHSIGAQGYATHSRSSGIPLFLNRNTNDGIIADFRKDGTTVGSIGYGGGGILYNAASNYGLKFYDAGGANIIHPATTAGGDLNGSVDLGYAGARFKDLYLSGGVYLGGTGAANKLEDYEEGTWTPVLGGGATATGMTGTYTKVGRLVTAYLILENSTISGTPDYIVSGLPFTSNNSRTALSVTYFKTFNTTCESLGGFVAGNTSTMQFVGMTQGGNWVIAPLTAGSTRYAFATAVYQTA